MAAKAATPPGPLSPSQQLAARVQQLGDWRSALVQRLWALIHAADPAIIEAWKWRGVPVWEHGGIICTGETHKSAMKMTFAKGAALADPQGLFNSSLEGNTRRALDFFESAVIGENALNALVRAAVAANLAKSLR